MNSNIKSHVSGDLTTKKPNGKDIASSAEPVKRAGLTSDSPVTAASFDPKSTKPNGKAVCSAEAIKQSGGSAVSSVVSGGVLLFKDVKFGPQEGELRFRLIHFWEARNALTKILIGLEMLLIDEQGTVIQGFIPPSRIDTYLPHMIPGSIYRLNKFYGSKSKNVFRVADPDVTIAFSWNSVLSKIEDSPVEFPEDRFRFYGHNEFEAACDLKGDLYDYIGHLKLVNEQILNESLVLDEVEIASSRRLLVHVQTHDGPVMKLYLWDKAAMDFCVKFKTHGSIPSVISVTTVNPKRFGGVLVLSSLSSSRVFFDMDVQPTRDYLTWLESNSEVANMINAEIVTKAETLTIGELFSYIKQRGAKVAWFECTATIDDVVHGSPWYYIACGGCKTKATKGPTTLMCKKCGKFEVAGVAEYLAKLSVYDNNDHARFILLGDAGRELTGKPASELVESYFEANGSVGEDHLIPVPQALSGTIGQTRRFIVKISKHNLEGKTQALTVTKVLPLEAPAIKENVVEEPADEGDADADETVKRSSAEVVTGGGKRAKCG